MQKCSTGGIELQLGKSPDGGRSALPSAGDVKKSLNKYSFLLVPGLVAHV